MVLHYWSSESLFAISAIDIAWDTRCKQEDILVASNWGEDNR